MKALKHFATAVTIAAAAGSVHAADTEANANSCLSAEAGPNHDGKHDFDFLSGRRWSLVGKKRIGRFIGSTKFEEMTGFENSRRIGEKGMIEEVVFPDWRPDYKLVILRMYDPVTRRWSIYDAHNPNEISPPLYGTFHRGLGIFVGDDVIDNVPVKVRYIWTCDWNHPRFQQEFSNDGGKTWEIDWNIEFTEIK